MFPFGLQHFDLMLRCALRKFIVASYDNLVIRFYSPGILDVLNPDNMAGNPTVGTNVFKFLNHHATSLSRDYKAKVGAALRAGLAISIDTHLCTRRAMMFRGDERYATHWTPLKDEHGRVSWIVLTMGSLIV